MYDQFKIYFEAVKQVGDPKNYLEVAKAISQGTWENMIGIGICKFDQKTHLAIFEPELIPTPHFQIWDAYRWTVWPISGKWNLADRLYKNPSWFK